MLDSYSVEIHKDLPISLNSFSSAPMLKNKYFRIYTQQLWHFRFFSDTELWTKDWFFSNEENMKNMILMFAMLYSHEM